MIRDRNEQGRQVVMSIAGPQSIVGPGIWCIQEIVFRDNVYYMTWFFEERQPIQGYWKPLDPPGAHLYHETEVPSEWILTKFFTQNSNGQVIPPYSSIRISDEGIGFYGEYTKLLVAHFRRTLPPPKTPNLRLRIWLRMAERWADAY